MSDYEWVKRPPSTIERIIAGVFLSVLALSSASAYAGWRVFGQYDGAVASASVIFGVTLVWLGPQVRRKPPV